MTHAKIEGCQNLGSQVRGAIQGHEKKGRIMSIARDGGIWGRRSRKYLRTAKWFLQLECIVWVLERCVRVCGQSRTEGPGHGSQGRRHRQEIQGNGCDI